jgi:hypothetical protein
VNICFLSLKFCTWVCFFLYFHFLS